MIFRAVGGGGERETRVPDVGLWEPTPTLRMFRREHRFSAERESQESGAGQKRARMGYRVGMDDKPSPHWGCSLLLLPRASGLLAWPRQAMQRPAGAQDFLRASRERARYKLRNS